MSSLSAPFTLKLLSPSNDMPDTMDAAALRQLPRADVQLLAKAHNVKANTKTTTMVDALLLLYPTGVPSIPPRPAPAALASAEQPIKALEGRPTEGQRRRSSRPRKSTARASPPSPLPIVHSRQASNVASSSRLMTPASPQGADKLSPHPATVGTGPIDALITVCQLKLKKEFEVCTHLDVVGADADRSNKQGEELFDTTESQNTTRTVWLDLVRRVLATYAVNSVRSLVGDLDQGCVECLKEAEALLVASGPCRETTPPHPRKRGRSEDENEGEDKRPAKRAATLPLIPFIQSIQEMDPQMSVLDEETEDEDEEIDQLDHTSVCAMLTEGEDEDIDVEESGPSAPRVPARHANARTSGLSEKSKGKRKA